MEISVWDTYVKREDGKLMHFDILVPSTINNEVIVFDFGNQYLQEKPFLTKELSTKECKYCHIEIASKEVKNSINNKGYYIIEMQNCD
jgi:hypothetical protein